jgi:short-subunit dehydrogenase
MARPVALVTGASAGIGRAFAVGLADRGYDLVVVARRADALEALAAELASSGASTEVLAADLTSADGLAAVEQRLADPQRPIDLLVNNAGYGTAGIFHTLPVADEVGMIDLNITALVRLTHAALGPMTARRSGGVINVSSTASYQPAPGNATYSATKAFVSSFTQAIHEEVRGRGVKAIAVCPGFTHSEFQARAGMEAEDVPGFMWQEPEDVVAGALKAYDRGRAVVITGIINQMTAAFATVSPGVVTRKIAGRVMAEAGKSRAKD